MRLVSILAAAAALAAVSLAAPVMAEPGQGRHYDEHRTDHGRYYRDHERRNYRGEYHDGRHGEYRGDRDHHRDDHGWKRYGHCPPGQGKKDGRCHDYKQERKYREGRGVGDRLNIRDYAQVQNPGRYNLQARRGWRYFRDDHRIYRVDADSNRVLAIYGIRR